MDIISRNSSRFSENLDPTITWVSSFSKSSPSRLLSP